MQELFLFSYPKAVKANDVQYIICNCTQTKQIDTEPICATWGINY